jgi:two-component system response regulator RegA
MSELILVIDDDETFNAVLVNALRRRGLEAEGCTDPAMAVASARRLRPARIVLDLNLNGTSGLSLVQPLLDVLPDLRIVVLTGYASIATAVDAIKLGACQYLAKPVEMDAILMAFDSVVAPHRTSRSTPKRYRSAGWNGNISSVCCVSTTAIFPPRRAH